MDDLDRLKEMAGLTENPVADEAGRVLSELSNHFEFEVDEYGSITVYSIGGTPIGEFEDFDHLLATGLR